MEFLKDAALPQSPGHFQLIIFIAAIASMVLIPYLAMAVGSSVLSVLTALKGSKEKDRKLPHAAQMVAERITGSMSTILFLGILPALSVVFVYAQILQTTSTITVGLAGFGFLFLAAGFILIYTYIYTLRLGGILDAYAEALREDQSASIAKYRSEHKLVNRRSGIYGAILLVVAAFLFVSAYGLAIDRASWNDVQSVFGLFLSLTVSMRLLLFAALSVGITGFGMLYFTEAVGQREHEGAGWHETPGRMVVISLLIMPLLMLLILIAQPLSTMSGAVYLLTGLTGFFYFVSAHFLYGYYTRRKPGALRFGFYAFLTAAAIWIANDHIALSNATKQESAVLAAAQERAKEEMRSKLGIIRVEMTGEDIFNAKCSSCHLYDAKKVGPAYNDVLPKYGGDKAKLIAFVMNPQKVDPAYPPMPAQGLKAAEADSIVTYLLSKISPIPGK